MSRAPSARAYLYGFVGAFALVGGLALGRPELVAIGTPFLVVVVFGLAHSNPGAIEATLDLDQHRAMEGERLTIRIAVRGDHVVRRFELRLGLDDVLTIVQAEGCRVVGAAMVEASVGSSGETAMELQVEARRWGVYDLDRVTIFAVDALGVFVDSHRVPSGPPVKILPDPETARRLLKPVEVQLAYGDLVSRWRGPGLEFADLREFETGDDPRRINWRASARRGELWVNDRHPERNSDVVLLIDALPEARRGVGASLDLAVRAIAGLAGSHLHRHDRVGLVTFGEPIRWLLPGMGGVQRYRILDALLQSRATRQLYWRGISGIPRRVLPSKALIICLTPLLDDRVIDAIADLKGRRFDVAVVEIPAEAFVAPATNRIGETARRIWELERSETRSAFARHGIPVVRWDPGEPFETPLMEVETFRRHAAHTRA